MSFRRNVGSSSGRRTTSIPSVRSNSRPRSSSYLTNNSYSSGSGYNTGFGGNSYGHGYSSSSYGSNLGSSSYYPSSYGSYGSGYSTYGGTSSGYGSLHLPSSSLSASPSSSSYMSSSPSSSFKHVSPGGYTKLNRSSGLSSSRSGLASRSSSTTSLSGLSTKSEGSEGYGSEDGLGRSSQLSSASSNQTDNDDTSKPTYNNEATENGEIDYKKLYEESLAQNERLREKLKKTEDELLDARYNIEKHVNMNKSSLSEVEKRERRALERKLSEMEEELKVNGYFARTFVYFNC
ncbi:UNVERIFIED_CONTAM: hypothetical protein PYX00_001688 [Menopon gallinae]|uniref:cGMP-dependent protein kinase interacting domain-containing protein n=1 Tax=Menopon gallinae TaxID=328185 RepID=A0AAW2IFF4_9NEOP